MDKQYYEENLKEAENEKIVYMQALKNYHHCFEVENENDMITFCAKKLTIINENIVFYENKIKELGE